MVGVVRNLTGTFMIEKGGKGSGHKGHRGRPGMVGGSAPGIGVGVSARDGQRDMLLSNMRFDPETTNGEFASSEITKYMEVMPDNIAQQSSLRNLIVDENPEGVYDWLHTIAPDEAAALDMDMYDVRGVYDRNSGTAIVSLWIGEDSGYSGRNFYHEYGHSLEKLITSDGWERAWDEWPGTQDEGFADAFSEFMVALSSVDPGEMGWYREYRPESYKFFRSVTSD